MIDKENNIIPFERGYEKKDEETADIQNQLEELLEKLKQLHEELNRRMKFSKASDDEKEAERLQGLIFNIEKDMEKTGQLLMEGDLRRFELQKKALETKWKREDKDMKR